MHWVAPASVLAVAVVLGWWTLPSTSPQPTPLLIVGAETWAEQGRTAAARGFDLTKPDGAVERRPYDFDTDGTVESFIAAVARQNSRPVVHVARLRIIG
jgi:hypothetical protein